MTDHSKQIMRGIIEFGDLPQEGLSENLRLVQDAKPKCVNPADSAILKFVSRFAEAHDGQLPTAQVVRQHYDTIDRLDITERLTDYEALPHTSDGASYAWLIEEHAESSRRTALKQEVAHVLRILSAEGPVEIGTAPNSKYYDPGAASAVSYIQSVNWGALAASETDDGPVPFDLSGDIHPFPLSVLPGRIPQYVEAVATAYNVPTDMVAVCVMQAMSIACQHYVEVEIHPDWVEPAVLWTMVVAPPASKKNGIYNEVMRPIREYSRQQHELWQSRISAASNALEAGRAAKVDPERLRELQEALDEVPPPHRPMVGDSSPEMLIRILAQYPSSALCHADTMLLHQLVKRYKRSSDLTIALNGYDAQDIQYDRVGSGKTPVSIHVEKGRLGMFCLTQHKSLNEMNDANENYRESGAQARICVYCAPPVTDVPATLDPPPVPGELRAEYDRLIEAMLHGGNTTPTPDQATVANSDDLLEDVCLEDTEIGDPPALLTYRPSCLDVVAEGDPESWFRQVRWVAEEAKLSTSKLHYLVDWIAKWPGRMARITGILEHARATVGDSRPFDGHDLLLLSTFYLHHASAAFAQPNTEGPQMTVTSDLCQRIGSKLAELAKKKGSKFTVRDAQRKCQSVVNTAARLKEILDLLEERGWLSTDVDYRKSRPRQMITWHGMPVQNGVGQ